MPPPPTSQPLQPRITPAPTPSDALQAGASPWPRLRQHFAMQSCDYNPAVQHWTRLYAQPANQFAASLSAAMPFLLVVLDQLEKHHLPGEFAFLPYLESTYTPLQTSGDRAAGIWQLMPDTAREAGLGINADYDGRLDIYASTLTAMGLLQQYQEEFGDWRLADMAFNAGEYRVRQLLRNHHGTQWSARELGRLNVNPGTHDHLAKLLALACVVSDPERFGIELPEPQDGDNLVVLNLPAPVDLHLAARLAGVDDARLLHLNPGFLHARMPADGPFYLLVPAERRSVVEQTLGKLPQYLWRDWREVTLKQPETLDIFAMADDISPDALASINGVDATAPLAPGTHLLLPGQSGGDAVVALVRPSEEKDAPLPNTVTVHAGDTLWDIAHRYRLHVEDLLRWNGMSRDSTLRLGERVRLTAQVSAKR